MPVVDKGQRSTGLGKSQPRLPGKSGTRQGIERQSHDRASNNPGDVLSQRPSGVFMSKPTTRVFMQAAQAIDQHVADALSAERLAPYRRVTGGALRDALRLYEWNLAASGALYEALGVLEVVLRNALSVRLAAHHGTLAGEWYDDPLHVFSDQARKDIDVARDRVNRLGRPQTVGRVVAELGFGFWKFLLAKRYEATLWTGHLRHAFPNLRPQTRVTAYRALDRLHTLRNRIAHHEPIHRRDLVADSLTIYRLLDWIDADVRAWAVALSRLQPVLAARPNVPYESAGSGPSM